MKKTMILAMLVLGTGFAAAQTEMDMPEMKMDSMEMPMSQMDMDMKMDKMIMDMKMDMGKMMMDQQDAHMAMNIMLKMELLEAKIYIKHSKMVLSKHQMKKVMKMVDMHKMKMDSMKMKK